MNELRCYLHAEHGRVRQLAALMGWDRTYLSQIVHGRRPMPAERAAELEGHTGGAVRRWHMFPQTWHRIWPELIGTNGAPPTPAAANTEETQHAA